MYCNRRFCSVMNIFVLPSWAIIGKILKKNVFSCQNENEAVFLLQASEKRDYNEHSLLEYDFSWMSQVNPARSQDEQNMEAIRTPDGDQIYFRTTRDISSGEELRVWLAPSLEEEYRLRRISGEGFKGQLYQHYTE